jgi:hypothetical protein
MVDPRKKEREEHSHIERRVITPLRFLTSLNLISLVHLRLISSTYVLYERMTHGNINKNHKIREKI